ncbi:flotillin family protein [Dongia rigui]|uniref:Flotillin domain-containing protein n=1 Tax=Dongia rigui TaxID=940149 RepID=A0ABU5DZQ6_9PROT|nr:flotillin domain-containing protein [Dongia rigui]MDY0872770.1 flotillin domain-containing protein [Dongia rigui]
MIDLVIAVALPALIGLVAILAIGLVIARLYARAEKDRSYVRTGLGGQKVVLDGGSIVLPVFQSIRWVNLQTLRLDVRRENADAMITKDRMRVDIGVEFYVRVKPDQQSIALAAQTLGDRTNDADALRELVEAKFVDALRSVAATMALADLQEKRADFVRRVQETVASDLELNGLELESASLTKLDQTDTKFFNPNNAFDAEGLAALTKITEAKRQERNLTVRAAEVAIAQQDLEARQKTLDIDRQKKEAELSQERDIVNKTAETRAAAALKEAEAQRAEAEARITTQQAVALREAEAKQAQEQARISAELAIQQRKIEADRTAETLAIGKKRDIELADQERAIAVADRSRAESDARAEAEKARALAIAAEESVTTAQQVAIAERERQIAVLAARQAAEQEATKVTVQAQAERNAADDRAEAVRTSAKADSDAALIRAEAQAKTYAVEAEGQRAINEARNALSAAMVELEVMRERLRIIPVAIAEAVRPLEKISDVRIVDMGGGLPGGQIAGENGGGRIDNLMSQLLAYRANAPVIDQLLKDAGFTEGTDLVNRLMVGAQPVAKTNGSQAPAAE